jgi:hypothetical protein
LFVDELRKELGFGGEWRSKLLEVNTTTSSSSYDLFYTQILGI